jgi:hypothetical protein
MKISNEHALALDLFCLLVLLFCAGVLDGIAFMTSHGPLSITLLIVVGFIVLGLAAWFIFKDFLDRKLPGVIGEFIVRVLLTNEKIDHINDIHLKNIHGNIDHVAVTRSGVWVIETKFTRCSVSFKDNSLSCGRRIEDRWLQYVSWRAKKIQEYLRSQSVDVPVRSVLVFAYPDVFVDVGTQPVNGSVYVKSSRDLRALLTDSDKDMISVEKVKKIIQLIDILKKKY